MKDYQFYTICLMLVFILQNMEGRPSAFIAFFIAIISGHIIAWINKKCEEKDK